MIGLTIGLIVIGVAMGALLISRGVSGTVSDASGIQQQASYAMRVIGTQLRQAGSLRLNLSPNTSASAAAAAASGVGGDAYLTEVAFETLAPATGGTAFDPASDTITGTNTSLTTGYRRYKEPVYSASAEESLVRNCLGGPAEANKDQKVESVFTFNASTNELRCSGNGMAAQPILQNVANFQVRYLLQNNTTMTSTGSLMRNVAAADVSNWSQVQAVEVCLVLYGNEPIDMAGLDASATTYTDCDGTTSVNMATLTGGRARRMHLLFRNVFQLRSQGLT